MTLPTRFPVILVAIVLATWASPTRAADDGVVLKWKFKPGQTSRYAASVDMKMQQKSGGGEADEATTKQTSDMTWVVDSVDEDGNAHITQTIERIRTVSSARGEEQTFDSNEEKPTEGQGQAGDPMRLMLNQSVHLTIDPLGKVIDARPSEKLAEKLKQSGPLGAMFSRESLKQMVSTNMLEFPDEPVSRGTTWQQQFPFNDPVAGRQTLVTTYRYDGTEERDGQTLDKISATRKLSGNQGAGQRMTIKDHKSNGVVRFDRGLGRVHEMEMTERIVSEVTQGANKLEMAMTTKMSMRLVGESDKGDK